MIFSPLRFARALPVVTLLFVFSSCGTLKKMHLLPHRKAKAAAGTDSMPRRVGTITLVDEAGRFVLIDTGTEGVPALGTALRSFSGETASGVVAVGNVSRRPFVAADIVQGAPKKGDGVFQ